MFSLQRLETQYSACVILPLNHIIDNEWLLRARPSTYKNKITLEFFEEKTPGQWSLYDKSFRVSAFAWHKAITQCLVFCKTTHYEDKQSVITFQSQPKNINFQILDYRKGTFHVGLIINDKSTTINSLIKLFNQVEKQAKR